jgi:UDP-N-acetylmuramoylalanine--D-glutamate ligase
MAAAWRDCVPVRECGDLDAAVLAAQEDVQAGEAVVLSPGCASFDQFSNYKERGSKFRAIVEECR